MVRDKSENGSPIKVRMGPIKVRMGPIKVRMGPIKVRMGPIKVRMGPVQVRMGPHSKIGPKLLIFENKIVACVVYFLELRLSSLGAGRLSLSYSLRSSLRLSPE